MTSPDRSQDRLSPLAPATTPVPTAAPTSNDRPTAAPTALQPARVQGRDGQDVPTSTPIAASGVDSRKAGGSASTGTHVSGGGSLRQAVQELVASIECLCGDAAHRDESGAKRHLALAQRILSAPPRDGMQRNATETRTAAPVPATRDGGTDGDIQQDLQRAMR